MSYRAAIIADQPLAYWPLQDRPGSATLADVSGNGYNLTPNTSGVTLGATGALVDGGGALGVALDGATGFLTAPAGLAAALGVTGFTLEVWLTLPVSLPAGGVIVYSTDNPTVSPFDGYDAGVNNNGSTAFLNAANGVANTGVTHAVTPTQPSLQPWHMVWTFAANGSLRVYSNGVQIASTAAPATIAAGRFALTIGKLATGSAGLFQGVLQHAAVYKYVLSASQVATHYSVGLAGDAAFAAPSLQGLKQQIVQVLSPSGAFIDVWRDAPLLAGVKFAINSATQPLQVTLPRSFDSFDEGGTPGARGSIAQGNIVQYYLFGPGLPSAGLLKYQGVIDGYAPEIDEAGEERVTVTITPFDSVVADNSLQAIQSFGTPGSTGSYVDPLTMFDYWFSHTDPISGLNYASPLTLNGSNPASSGVTSQYTFQNQQLAAIFNTVLQMLPANWYWRVNADKTVSRNVSPTSAQHQFVIGQHIVAPQYKKDWSKLKNVGQIIGNGLSTSLTSALVNGTPYTSLAVKALPANVLSGQQLLINDGGNPVQLVTLSANANQGATTVSVTSFTANAAYPIDTQCTILVSATRQGSDLTTFGKRVMQVADNRVIDQNTAALLAQGLVTAYDQMLLRTKIRVVDYRGDAQTGLGYDIETILPGDSCQIINPRNTVSNELWDAVQWDVAFWDYSPAAALQQVVIIVSVTYGFDYVDLELASAQPSQDRELVALQIAFQDFSLV